jgi:hypothetical protein
VGSSDSECIEVNAEASSALKATMSSYFLSRMATLPLLGVLIPVVGCTQAIDGIEWWHPAFGILQLYSFDEDVVPEAVLPQASLAGSVAFRGVTKAAPPRRRIPMEKLILLGEESVDTRVSGSEGLQEHGILNAVVGGSGSGLGAGKGANKGNITFAGAGASATSAIIVKDVRTATNSNITFAGADASATSETIVKDIRTATNSTSNANSTTAEKQPLQTRSWFSFLRFSFSFAFVVKALCMMCNIFYQASPLPLISEFKLKGCTGDADLAPFIATAYGGWQWCFYGLFAYIVTQKSGFLVLVYSNVVGAILGLYYVYAFHLHCNNALMLQKSSKYYMVLAFLVLIQFIAIMISQPVHALFFSGLISSVWSTIGSLALVTTVPKVYETKSSKSLPAPLLIVGEISAILWLVCGVVLWDPWITFPNAFALLVCTFALHLCWKFPATGCDMDEDGAEASTADPLENGSSEFGDVDILASPNQRASPLQRALDFVHLSSNRDSQSLQHHAANSARYGATSYKRTSTGGTGDSF